MPERMFGSWRDILRLHAAEFARGAFTPSLPAIIGAILTAGAIFGLAMWRITPAFVAERGGYLVRDREDVYAYLTAQTLRLARDRPAEPVCVLIGDSIIREAITSERELTREVCKKAGRTVSVHLLVAGGLSHWEAVSLTDCIRGRVHGVVAIEITPYNLTRKPRILLDLAQHPRLAVPSSAQSEECRLMHFASVYSLHNYFLDHYGFFAARVDALANLWSGPVQPPQHRSLRLWGADDWAKGQPQWELAYQQHHAGNLGIYGRMITRLRESGRLTIVLLEGPENPRLKKPGQSGDGSDPLQAGYRGDVAAFARDHALEYWDLVALAELKPEEFWDFDHIRSASARKRFTEVLATRLANSLCAANFMEGDSK
ncbi:MAG: hypothetical protein ABSH20_24470 [Tepidisphaeraceae bacterium]|jgi:hypothetical protein